MFCSDPERLHCALRMVTLTAFGCAMHRAQDLHPAFTTWVLRKQSQQLRSGEVTVLNTERASVTILEALGSYRTAILLLDRKRKYSGKYQRREPAHQVTLGLL